MTKIWQYCFETLLDYLWIRVHLCTFLFYSFQYTRTSLWSNMKPRFVFTNYQFLWNSKVVWLWSVVYQIYLPINLFFFFLDESDNQTCSLISPRCSLEFWRLSPPFSIFLLLPLPTRPSRTICEFTNFHKYIFLSSKTIYLKTKTGLCDCYLYVIMKRCHLYR